MAATARLIVLMEEDEKAALASQAAAAHVSTAELVRRRLFSPGDPEERAFLHMLGELKPLARMASKTIDANLAAIKALRKDAVDADVQMSERTREELTGDELESIADRLGLRREPTASARRRRTRR